MKILQIFGAVIAVHVLAFVFIFASPGCSSSPRNIPTPDATAPSAGSEVAPVASNSVITYQPQPVDLAAAPALNSTPGRAEPTRPGSPNAAAIAPATTPKPEVAPVSSYTVTRGDSLWSVAKKHRLSVAELAKANGIPTNATLQPGKKLIIPGKAPAPEDLATASAPKAEATKPARSNDAVEHTVLPGESLGVIARKYQVTVGELVEANSITDPTKVRAGQKLVIPGYKAVGSTAKKPAAPATKANGNGAKSGTAAKAAPATTTPAAEPTITTPKFEIAPPPPGQDLDSGLKDTATDVPTIKVEEPKPKG